MSKGEQPRRRIIFNNDGSPHALSSKWTAVSWDTFIRENVTCLVDTQVDTLFWNLESGHVFAHDTKVGEFLGEGLKHFRTEGRWTMRQNVRRLIDEGHDPLRGVVEEGHKAGLEVFASFRMNDIHDSRDPDGLGSFKREHPEYLLGDSVNIYEMGRPHKYSSRTCFNYAIAEVREFRLQVMRETLDRYDVDGLELDWSRHPWAFKPGEEQQNMGIMNQFMREIRSYMDNVAQNKGRRLFLAVSLPPTFEECREIGFDVQTWLREELIDIIIAGAVPFHLPLTEMRQATKKVGCQLFSRFGGSPGQEQIRAAALTHYRDGVDGVYLFNCPKYFSSSFAAKNSQQAAAALSMKQCVNEIGDPQALERLDKHYVIAKRRDSLPSNPHSPLRIPGRLWVHSTRRPAVATEPLPVALTVAGSNVGQTVSFKVADELESARTDDAIDQIKLRLSLTDFSPQTDEIAFKLNGQSLTDYSSLDPTSDWLEFNLEGAALKHGENKLEVILKHRNPQISVPVVLDDVELFIKYRR